MSGVSGVSGASGSLGKSPAGGGTFTFPPPTQPLTHKAAVYYHHQLALSDDQGIDMTQVREFILSLWIQTIFNNIFGKRSILDPLILSHL